MFIMYFVASMLVVLFLYVLAIGSDIVTDVQGATSQPSDAASVVPCASGTDSVPVPCTVSTVLQQPERT